MRNSFSTYLGLITYKGIINLDALLVIIVTENGVQEMFLLEHCEINVHHPNTCSHGYDLMQRF